MPSGVIHQPRVAWDAARTLVAAAQADISLYAVCFDEVAALLGTDFAAELNLTRARLAGDPFTANVEAGKWRVRVEDVLRARPDLAEALQRLAADTRSRLP